MPKRARMTTEDVLDELELADDQDDFDEPMMPGSDDEFSDCELEEEDLKDEITMVMIKPSLRPQLSRQLTRQPLLPQLSMQLPHPPLLPQLSRQQPCPPFLLTGLPTSPQSPEVTPTRQLVLLCQSLRKPLKFSSSCSPHPSWIQLSSRATCMQSR